MFKKLRLLRRPLQPAPIIDAHAADASEQWAPDPDAPISPEVQHMVHFLSDTPEEYGRRLEEEFKKELFARKTSDA